MIARRVASGLMATVTLWLALAAPAAAELLTFAGGFHTLYDCPDTWPGSQCGSPPPQSVNIPFTFTLDATPPIVHTDTSFTTWQAPEFPLPPALLTQATFESLAGRTRRVLEGTNSYEDPLHGMLYSFAGRTHVWEGTDAQGRQHVYIEGIGVAFDAVRKLPVGTPVTAEEVQALWSDYRSTGRAITVHADLAWSITRPDGSFQAAGHVLQGTFRLCRAPGGLGGALAALTTRLRGG